MNLIFHKYQGTGNDFIMVNQMESVFELDKETIEALCSRRFGVGADGLIIMRAHPEYDFEMVYYNADGNKSTMCGNGARCITRFASDQGIDRAEYHFLAVDGPHKSALHSGGNVSLQMSDVIGVLQMDDEFVVNTGSPHFVKLHTSTAPKEEILEYGKRIRYSPRFKKEGINVNQVTFFEGGIMVRTYERGVENETLSCGTGVVASALCAHSATELPSPIRVNTMGGMLTVKFDYDDGGYINVWLTGPATPVFSGSLELD